MSAKTHVGTTALGRPSSAARRFLSLRTLNLATMPLNFESEVNDDQDLH